MAKEKKKTTNNTNNGGQNPEVEERKRLKRLSHINSIISETPAKGFSPLNPSKTVIKHHGKDILKKSQRKNRYLFSFSGLLAPISGGKIGQLTDLASKNPILYLEFPQGRMKLLGTIVYPKNRYLTLQFSRGGKNVMCEDCFDSMVVFSEAYWVGKKEDNPEEVKLDYPEELHERKQLEFDFQGGAGSAGPVTTQSKIVGKSAEKFIEEESQSDSPLDDMETESPDREDNVKDIEYATPVRHSERTAGKRFKFTEVSSGDDSAERDSVMSAEANDEAAVEANDILINDQNFGVSETTGKLHESEDIRITTVEAPPSGTSTSVDKKSSRGSLVQANISTLFMKVEQKSTTEDAWKNIPNKASKKSAQLRNSKSKNKSATVHLVPEAAELLKVDKVCEGKKSGARTGGKKQKAKVAEAEDDIEEFSSPSEENVKSDEDWSG